MEFGTNSLEHILFGSWIYLCLRAKSNSDSKPIIFSLLDFFPKLGAYGGCKLVLGIMASPALVHRLL